jgi:hypothetical protein
MSLRSLRSEGWEGRVGRLERREVGRAWCERRLVLRAGQGWGVEFVRLGLEEGRV